MSTKILKAVALRCDASLGKIRSALMSTAVPHRVTISPLRSEAAVESDGRCVPEIDISAALLNAGCIPCDVRNYYY